MNGRVAKRIRKAIYGSDLSPKVRVYTDERLRHGGGQLNAGDLRRHYKRMKRAQRGK